MTIDLNNAGPQRTFELIPAGTICTVQATIRAGGAGTDGWLKRSADGGSEALDCEFTVLDGEYAGRKVWQLLTLSGTTPGHETAGEISRALLRGIVESARNVLPSDTSEAAAAKRRMDLANFNNLRFIARITIEKSRDPNYPDKNRLQAVTPDLRGWHAVEQIPMQPGAGAPVPAAASTKAPAQTIARPAWAG